MFLFTIRQWLILYGCFLLNVMSFGIGQSFGVIYSELLTVFHVDHTTVSWIPSLYGGLLNVAGLLSGMILTRVGPRITIMGGTLLMTSGMIGSAFVTSPYILYLTYGILAGIGGSMLYVAGKVTVIQTFKDRRGLALGLASTGVGAGSLALPSLTELCIEQYGWRGAFLLLLGGICLQGAVVGSLVQKGHLIEEEKSATAELNTGENQGKSCGRLENCRRYFDFIDKKLLLFTVASFLVSAAYFVPYTLVPDMMVSKGRSRLQGSWIISSAGIGYVLGSIISGFFSDFPCINHVTLYLAACLLCGVPTLGLSLADELYQGLILGTLFGAGVGATSFLGSVIVLDIVGQEKLSKAFGFRLTVSGIGVFVGSPLAGWLTDIFGRYDEAFYFTSGIFTAAAVICIPLLLSSCSCTVRFRTKMEWFIARLKKSHGKFNMQHIHLHEI